jgi:hypothetical protein
MSIELKKAVQKSCAVCGKKILVSIYKKPLRNGSRYRNGHYFGKIPFHRKKDLEKAAKNTKKVTIGGFAFEVFKKDPRPYKYVEYWECPQCYRHQG